MGGVLLWSVGYGREEQFEDADQNLCLLLGCEWRRCGAEYVAERKWVIIAIDEMELFEEDLAFCGVFGTVVEKVLEIKRFVTRAAEFVVRKVVVCWEVVVPGADLKE